MTSESGNELPYVIVEPTGPRLPILISVPHCGTEYPPEVVDQFRPEVIEDPEDTDWFVHHLYDFLVRFGVTIIHARYSRYVIDLNRDPSGKQLYSDGRTETSIIPTHTFSGKPLYRSAAPDPAEYERRLMTYFVPYYQKVEALLKDFRRESRQVMVWDAHSIARSVPSIHPEPFSDLILGSQDGKTAHPKLIEVAMNRLSRGNRYKVANNMPFKGGYITRYFGKPQTNVHALQLEMSQDVYMDDERGSFDSVKAERIQPILRDTIMSLAEVLRRFP